MKIRPWGAPEVLGHVLPRCREKGPSEPSPAPEHPAGICSCRASCPGRWSSVSSTQVSAETSEAPQVVSPLHPALPRQTRDQQWPNMLPAGAGCGGDQDERREAGNLYSSALLGKLARASFSSLLGPGPAPHPAPAFFFPLWEDFAYCVFGGFLKVQGRCRYKRSHLLQALPFCIPFQILQSLFSFSSQERKLSTSNTRHRETVNTGNSGLLHHPRQIMPPIMQATHSHCQLHPNDSVISPFQQHKRALAPQPRGQPLHLPCPLGQDFKGPSEIHPKGVFLQSVILPLHP